MASAEGSLKLSPEAEIPAPAPAGDGVAGTPPEADVVELGAGAAGVAVFVEPLAGVAGGTAALTGAALG